MPSSRNVRKTRTAISPRLATRTFVNTGICPILPADDPGGSVDARARGGGSSRGGALRLGLRRARLVDNQRELLVSGLRLAALERGVVMQARDLSKLKTRSQATAAAIGGFSAAGAWSHGVAWWALLVALALTWLSG